VARLVHFIKHDLVGFLQTVKVGMELLERESLDRQTMEHVIDLVRQTLDRGFAYGVLLDDYAHTVDGVARDDEE
jgi:hypothetical protein